MAFTLDELKQLDLQSKKTTGLTLEQLKSGQTPQTPQAPQPPSAPGFLDRVRADINQRQTNFAAGAEAQSLGKQTFGETVLQGVGQGAGLLFDVAGEAFKSVVNKVPQAIKEPVKTLVADVLETPIGQAGIKAVSQGIDAYKEWKLGNPRAARDLEATVNIAMLLPVGEFSKAGQVVAEKSIQPLAEKVGQGLIKSGEKALEIDKKTFVENLVRQTQTKAVKEAQVARTSEVGSGIFKRSVIAPSSEEARAAKHVMEIPQVSTKNTIQGNYNIIRRANNLEAERLANSLKENDFIYPRKELVSRLNVTKDILSNNPVLTGDAEKTADKLIAEISRRINTAPSKGSNLLQVRKDFDRWVESQKGTGVFDPAKENAFSVANREIRTAINKFLEEKATKVDVKTSLQKQSSLFSALDNIKPKAAYEADTALKRFFQRAEKVLGTKNKAVQIIAATVGIGGLGAAATFAPAAAATGIGGYLIYRGGKFVLSPTIRKALGSIFVELGRKSPAELTALGISGVADLRNEIRNFVKDYE